MDRERLKSQLIVDEGERQFAYQDSLGYWTIGVGRNVDRRGGKGLSRAECMILLNNDIDDVEKDLDANLPWWRGLNDARQNVLANMCFNMGLGALLGFRNALGAMQHGEFDAAANAMEDSKWYREVGARAARLVAVMRSGGF